MSRKTTTKKPRVNCPCKVYLLQSHIAFAARSNLSPQHNSYVTIMSTNIKMIEQSLQAELWMLRRKMSCAQ